jgi:type II secretion system protein C
MPRQPRGNDSSISGNALPLILVRTQPGRNSREGFAQLGTDATSPQTYSAGALLANGARLAEIYADYVLLERDGHSARLYVHNSGLSHDVTTQTEWSHRLLTVGGIAAAPQEADASRERLTDYLRPSPVYAGNALHGYALYAGRDPEPFFKMGLHSGDVLTQIDGVAVSDSGDALAALRALLQGAAINVQIERDGRPQSLSLDGAIVAAAVQAGPPQSPQVSHAFEPQSAELNTPAALTSP